LKEHASGEMELICSLEKCWWSCGCLLDVQQKLQEWDQEIEASDTTSLYTTSTSKVEAADRTNELRSRQTKVKLLTPPAKLRRRKSGADLTP